MSQIDVASPAHITTEKILIYFSLLFYGDKPPASVASVFLAVDDWWYVPRNKKMLRVSLVRSRKAFLAHVKCGTLPRYVIDAHRWSVSHRFGKVLHEEDIAKNID